MRTPRAEYLILDIETVPDVQRWARPETPPAGGSNVEPAFPPTWAHRIIVIGGLWLDHRYRLQRFDVIRTAGDDDDRRERVLLAAFSEAVGATRPVIVTYNGRAFDLPVIALRSLCHAVPLAWYYRDRDVRYRYSEGGHLDLCDWLADHGAVRAGKLDAITRLVGLPGKSGMDGSQVEGMYRAGELAAIERYCLADVAQTALVFLRFRVLQGQLSVEDYRERVSELLADSRIAGVVNGLDRTQLLAAW